jgi:hypothetical protein
MKSCVAVLTRGYRDIHRYDSLIKRNQHIANNLKGEVDILIFHEGNIHVGQQIYIQKKTPNLLRFIDISEYAFKAEKENVVIKEAPQFNVSYRHMCSFWFVDFWNYVKDYDKLLIYLDI